MALGPGRLVVASQLVFLAALAVCVALRPGDLVASNEGGVSNFGVHAVTAVPFSAGFAGAAALLVAGTAAAQPVDRTAARLVVGLRVLAVALVAVLASTYGYQHGPVLHGLHVGVAIAATAYESALACFVAVAVRRDAASAAGLAAQLVGLALAIVALSGWLHALMVGQLVGAAGFAVVLGHAAPCLEARGARARA